MRLPKPRPMIGPDKAIQQSRRCTDHDRNGIRAADDRADAHARERRARSARAAGESTHWGEPACRHAADPAGAVADGETRRVGRHCRRKRRGKDHVAGDTRRTATAVRRSGLARRHHSRCPNQHGCPYRVRPAGRHHPPRDAPPPNAALRGPAEDARGHFEQPRRTAWSRRPCDDLDLADRAEVPVRALSGGQRKRASIAVELLTRPRLFFLDEPTSGLDPSTAADVMRLLRTLSRRGVTVVLTTHEPAGIDKCDRVIFLARDGHLAFSGSPAEARRYFGVQDLAEVYERLAARIPRRSGRNASMQSVGTTEAQPGDDIPPIPAHPSRPSAQARSGNGGY